jgi:hypothetical protein
VSLRNTEDDEIDDPIKSRILRSQGHEEGSPSTPGGSSLALFLFLPLPPHTTMLRGSTPTKSPSMLMLCGGQSSPMEGTVEYWKSRALTAEDAFRQIQSELRKERRERKEYEALLIQKFDHFCQSTEDRLVAEMKQQMSHSTTSAHRSELPNGGSSARSGEDLMAKRSNTPTPRRAAPAPPKRTVGP